MSYRKKDSLMKLINGMVIDLPASSSLSYLWGFGSLLGVFLVFQIVTGLFLALHFSGDVNLSFSSVVSICRDVNFGWLLRVVHSNGASLFFLFLYFHIGRGLYYGSYVFSMVWMSGVTIFLVSMGVAFLGYVLPWGQMSFWAATVITNLLSAVPYVGVLLVEWVWGGFAVGNATLVRFFSFHFLLPFVIVFLVGLHLMFLHQKGSGNPLGVGVSEDKIPFAVFFVVKDLVGFVVAGMLLMFVSLYVPFYFMDVENFIMANSMVTPVHIQPEWYFLFAYSILRAIASKIGGVVALLFSIFILYLFPLIYKQKMKVFSLYFFKKFLFWCVVVNWGLLTWIGACVVEVPYVMLGKIFSVVYFGLYGMLWGTGKMQDIMMECCYF